MVVDLTTLTLTIERNVIELVEWKKDLDVWRRNTDRRLDRMESKIDQILGLLKNP